MKILVVEDEPDIRRNLASLLRMEGHELLEAGNGLDGLQLARLHTPSLILSDIMMPSLDGYGMLEQLRSDPRTSMIPLIFLTAMADRDDTRRGMKLGAHDYIAKPFSWAEVLDAVDAVVKRQRILEDSAIEKAAASFEDANRISRHDIKTPLSFLASAPSLLRAARTISPEEELILNMMEAAAKRAIDIVDMTLAISQMESGRYVLRPAAVNVSMLALSVAKELAGHAESKSIRLQIDGTSPHSYVHGEESLCYSILANLLKNAIEASPENSDVLVRVQSNVCIQVTIENRGSIPESIRANFFGKYATSGKPKGIGLGTYSSRLFAVAQGGSLTADCSCKGVTKITLELARVAPESISWQDAHASPAQRTLSALVVDDDEFNRMVMQHHLSSTKVSTTTAVNGLLALEDIRRSRPDVIFLDIEMPVMGGVETLAEVRKFQAENGQIPSIVIAVSGHDDAVSVASHLAIGFNGSLPKSCSQGDVLQLLDKLLDRGASVSQ